MLNVGFLVGRQRKIRQEIHKSKDRDGFVDDLLFTQFCDKARVLTKLPCFSSRKRELRDRMKEIEDLRNKLAHANDYAATPDAARKVCAVVRNLLDLREEIEDVAPAPDSERLVRMRQAVQDPLFLADLKDTMEAFAPADSEWWESGR